MDASFTAGFAPAPTTGLGSLPDTTSSALWTHLGPAHEAGEGGVAVGHGHDAGGVGCDEGGARQGQARQLPGAHRGDEDRVRAQRAVHLVCLGVQEVQAVRHLWGGARTGF